MSFIVLSLTFRSTIQLEFIFVYDVRKQSRFIFSPPGQSTASASFNEKNHLSSLLCRVTFLKNLVSLPDQPFSKIKYPYLTSLISVFSILLNLFNP
jgi:hypothetical protein